MEMMGDKITARQTVHHAGVPVIPGSNGAVNHVSEIENLAKDIGYPVVIKAASGGGGKGIRIVKKAEGLEKAFKEAKSEGKNTLMMIVFMLRLLYLLQNMLKFKLWEMGRIIMYI
ncbi:biotin carboxylase [Staphylococcus aureus]|nr:biotin carboxylase [Staphylococcus aureus]